MANYAAYYNQGNPSRPPMPQQQHSSQNQPASSTWTSTISSRFATFTKFLTRDSEEDDPENEDCSHVSNVLRAYYTEKGRQFPSWLPPDPKKPQRQQQYPMQQAQYGYGQYENAYGNPNFNPTHSRGGSAGGALNDIFADTRTQQQQPPPTQSLRAPRPSAHTARSSDNMSGSRLNVPTSSSSSGNQPTSGARPLPSQRAGSYQNQNPSATSAQPVSSRDRLKFKVGGGGGGAGGSGRNSPVPNQSGQNSYTNAQYTGNVSSSSASQPWSSSGNYDNYGTGRDNRGYGNTAYQQRPSQPR